MFPETIETDSLVLRPLGPDAVDLFELYDRFAAGREAAAAVFEYIPQEPFEAPKDAHDWLREADAEWAELEYAKYAAFDADGSLVGVASLNPSWERRAGSLGVILDRPFWGHGYATECAEALAELAFDRLDLDLVSLAYDEGNRRSKAVIERFVERHGGQYDGVWRNGTVRGDEVVDNHHYTVSRDQYREAVGE